MGDEVLPLHRDAGRAGAQVTGNLPSPAQGRYGTVTTVLSPVELSQNIPALVAV